MYLQCDWYCSNKRVYPTRDHEIGAFLESIHTDLRQTFILSLRVISKTSASYMPLFRDTFIPGTHIIQKIGFNSPTVVATILRQQPYSFLLKQQLIVAYDFFNSLASIQYVLSACSYPNFMNCPIKTGHGPCRGSSS
jgi:hypothetical protein